MYLDRVEADLGRKVRYFAYLPAGILVVTISSIVLYLVIFVPPPGQIGVGDAIFLSFSFLIMYAIGFGLVYIFFRRGGYPTSYAISDRDVSIWFHKRRLLAIPFSVIEGVDLDSEGPSLSRFVAGGTKVTDMVSRKSKSYVAIKTGYFTHYLSPSNPERFINELDQLRGATIAPAIENKIKLGAKFQRPRAAFLKKILAVSFAKLPVGPLLATLVIDGVMISLGYPQLGYLLSVAFLIGASVTIYFFSPQIASELLNSRPSTSAQTVSALASLAEKAGCPTPKLQIADPAVLGINAMATGPSTSRSAIILTENVERLPDEQVNAILAHELAHIKHRDPLKLALINSVFIAFLFFAPNTNILLLAFVSTFLAMSIVAKIFEAKADTFSAKITSPSSLALALQGTGEDAAYRVSVFLVTLLGRSKPIEGIRESIGLRQPRSKLRRAYLWMFGLHPPLYYRIERMNRYNRQK